MLVGRDWELAELRAALSRIATGGALYLFTGEPGIGKTRLAAESASLAREHGIRVSWGRCWEAGGAPPFWPWREALEGCGVPFPDVASMATGDLAEARFALFREIASTLGREAAREPLMIVLEDLHAADLPTLVLLEFVASQLRAVPIVVIGTYRDLEARLRPDVGDLVSRLGRTGRVFQLAALSESHVGAILGDAIDGADERLAAKVYEITRGNPLFVDEMVRDVRARGIGHGVAIPLGVREIMPLGSHVPLRDRGVAQGRLGRAEAMLHSARSFMYETMAETWARTQAGQAHTMAQRADILLAAAHAAQAGAEVTDMMFTSGGSSAVYTRHPMERLFRDAQVIRQHGFVAASRYETVAQVMLGLDPDLPLLYF